MNFSDVPLQMLSKDHLRTEGAMFAHIIMNCLDMFCQALERHFYSTARTLYPDSRVDYLHVLGELGRPYLILTLGTWATTPWATGKLGHLGSWATWELGPPGKLGHRELGPLRTWATWEVRPLGSWATWELGPLPTTNNDQRQTTTNHKQPSTTNNQQQQTTTNDKQ